MINAPLPDNEQERLHWLYVLQILDTLEEQAYDDLTYLAAQICETPIALVSLVDKDRQWFKSHFGLDARETPRDLAFCAHAILGDDLFEVQDPNKDERFFDNPLVTGGPRVQFYAGAPLVLRNDIRVGTLCVIDQHARQLNEKQKEALSALARQVVSQLELRLKVRELESLDQAKNEFISVVSHELRTPLTSINGSLGLLNSGVIGEIPSQAKKMLDIAHQNSMRLTHLINDLLDMEKLSAGKMHFDFQRHALMPLLEQSIETARGIAEQYQVRFCLSKRTDNAQVNVDEMRLQQVLANFLSNAAKFSPPGSDIEVTAQLLAHAVRVEVIDHGQGISDEFRKRIFQKFSQADASNTRQKGGTGLGLAISKELIERMHGAIGFESTVGIGSCFYFELPLLNN